MPRHHAPDRAAGLASADTVVEMRALRLTGSLIGSTLAVLVIAAATSGVIAVLA